MSEDRKHFVLPNTQPIAALECTAAFDKLTDTEKAYAHHISRAAWYGGLIAVVQCSPEAPLIYALLHRMLAIEPADTLRQSALAAGVSADDYTAFLVYASAFYGNAGNYKMGDRKVVPGLTVDQFECIVRVSLAYQMNAEPIRSLWERCRGPMYRLDERTRTLGLGEHGITTYFSDNCTAADADLVNQWLKKHQLEAYNCRTFKTLSAADGTATYEIRLASVATSVLAHLPQGVDEFGGARFRVTAGDYAPLLSLVVAELRRAEEVAANENQRQMLQAYVRSFEMGDLNAHKDGSRSWVQDRGPMVESYIGFIETYRDPAGVRGEFEGFVAMVNKEMSAKFGQLVENAEKLIEKLPWGAGLEKDSFLRPDFTSLEVLTFAGSGVPAGINIPNCKWFLTVLRVGSLMCLVSMSVQMTRSGRTRASRTCRWAT